jgi:hypothetical protein
MSEPIEPVVFSKMGGPLTKRITLTANGWIASDGSACTMARGSAKRERIGCVGELAALIEGLTSEQAIALGALRDDLPDEISIVTKAALANGPINGAVARTGDSLAYRPGRPALALFDYDLKGMPGEVAQRVAAAGSFWAALTSVLAALASTRAEVLVRHRLSTSAGLSRTRRRAPTLYALAAEEPERAGDDRAKAVTTLTHRLLADETLRQALVEPIIRNIAAGIATVVHHRRGAE